MVRVKKRVDNIIKSVEDKRLYRGVQFDNDLKVLLISDPTTDKSAAALDVNIGKAHCFGFIYLLLRVSVDILYNSADSSII